MGITADYSHANVTREAKQETHKEKTTVKIKQEVRRENKDRDLTCGEPSTQKESKSNKTMHD